MVYWGGFEQEDTYEKNFCDNCCGIDGFELGSLQHTR
jgi:hypothetical protein